MSPKCVLKLAHAVLLNALVQNLPEAVTRRLLRRNVDSRTTTLKICEAVQRRARIYGPQTFASLNSRLESNKEAEKKDAVSSAEDQSTGSLARRYL